jgi:hypothetical protein
VCCPVYVQEIDNFAEPSFCPGQVLSRKCVVMCCYVMVHGDSTLITESSTHKKLCEAYVKLLSKVESRL